MLSMPALTREQLDAIACDCGDGPYQSTLTLTPRCHPHSAVFVSYEDGIVSVTCAACQTVVAQIAVASEPGLIH
jgi:hypothetical protein